MQNAELDELQAGIKIAGRNNNLRYTDDTTLMAGTKEPLDKGERGGWKSQPKDGDCSHEIKRQLLLGRKALTNLDSVLTSKDITFLRKVHLVRAMVFPVVKYGCECCTIKKAECLRIDAFFLSMYDKYIIDSLCGVGEDNWESLGLQGDPTSPFWRRSALGFLWKEWC